MMSTLTKSYSPLSFLNDALFDRNAANFWLQKINPLWSVHQPLGRIVRKEKAAQGMVSLTLQCNRHVQMGRAGQHHPVFVKINGRRYERSYSVHQLDAQHVVLTVKQVDGGKVSQWLTEQSRPGDLIELGQPYGDMQLPEQSQPLILLAAGSGITPMLSLIEAWVKQSKPHIPSIQLLYWVRQPEEAAFQSRFAQLAKNNPAFNFQIFYTGQNDQRLNAEHLAQIGAVEQSVVYACGPSGFVTTAADLFAQAATFKSEAFSLSPSLSAEVGLVNITLLQSQKTVTIPKGQSILLGLEQMNLKPQHGCRMGICNKCVCHKVQGATRHLVNGAENTEPGNALKICVNAAQTDLVIDL